MKWGDYIVFVLSMADFGVAVAYALNKDYARVLYWAFAGSIALTTLFMH